jgi:hypothetical protein
VQTSALAALILAALPVAACGAGDRGAVGVGTESERDPPPPTASAPVQKQLYEGSGIVLERRDGPEAHGPQLCLGAIRMSLPPHCTGAPIANWDWDAVEGVESRGGTTWGAYHVVGTFVAGVFTVVESGPPAYRDEGTSLREIPCPEPESGWVAPDPEHNTQNDVQAAEAYSRGQPDYVSSWNEHLEPGREEFGPVLYVAVFTGNRERHEASIRERWNGPLCVAARDLPTARELARIRSEVEARLPALGLEILGSDTGGFEPAVVVEVVVDVDGRAQQIVDEEYGPGIVRIVPALRPAESR